MRNFWENARQEERFCPSGTAPCIYKGANQVSRDFSDITQKLSVAFFYGGTPTKGQIKCRWYEMDTLVGLPGGIKEHLWKDKQGLSKLKDVDLYEVVGYEQLAIIGYTVVKKCMQSTDEHVDLPGEKTDETKKKAQELSPKASIKQDAQSSHKDKRHYIPQKQREITLKVFRNGDFRVVACGLAIPEVDLIMQRLTLKDIEPHIHHSGQMGRTVMTGVCTCFYQNKLKIQIMQVEQKAGIKVKRIGVPCATEIIKASCKNAIKLLKSVPLTAIKHFKQSAEKLMEEKGALEALVAAMKKLWTKIMHCPIGMPSITYASMILKSNWSWKNHRKDIEASEDAGTAVKAFEDRKETERETSENSKQDN
ncbi:LOW QUALITY PROTEIN: Nucleolar RNA helicase 2, partial [Galemys pyrenaicus]